MLVIVHTKMTDETLILVTLTVVMLVGSYVAGGIPLVMRLSDEKLKTVTVLGAGLLVGTALTVIIPEGINSLYTNDQQEILIELNRLKMQQQEQQPDSTSSIISSHHFNHKSNHARTIGLSLVLGFVFMMLVDQVSQKAENITATIGLVVHAAADGVALGAAATTSHQDVEMIVFLAIMLHKAPAAFGLVSFLLHERVERQEIRKHLAIFSLSAPIFTLLTYFGIGQEQKETLNSVNATGIAMLFSAGTFLYVATVHVLPELTHSATSVSSPNHKHNDYEYHQVGDGLITPTNTTPTSINLHHHSPHVIQQKGLKFYELIIMITGALLPLIITFGHSH